MPTDDDLFSGLSAEGILAGLTNDAEANLEESQRIADLPTIAPDVDLEDTDEHNSEVYLDAVQEGFRARLSRENDRLAINSSNEYYVCVVFATEEQREAWKEARGYTHLGRRYIDGQACARIDGITLPEAPPWPAVQRPHRDLADLAMTVEENRAIPLGE